MTDNKRATNAGITPTSKKKIPLKLGCQFTHETGMALLAYQSDKGLPYPQDVVRLAVSILLRKDGYL